MSTDLGSFEDDEDEREQLELKLIALDSQLKGKEIMLAELVREGVEIEASVEEHARDIERDIAAQEYRARQAQVNAADLRKRAAKCRELNLSNALLIEEEMEAYEVRLVSIRKRERDAIAARREITESGREHVLELQAQVSALEQECARLQVQAGKLELGSATFGHLQRQYQARQGEADSSATSPGPKIASTGEQAVEVMEAAQQPLAPSTSAVMTQRPGPSPNPATLKHPQRQGYLLKLSPMWLVGFQRRYFYIENGKMSYYKLHTDRTSGLLALGEVPLSDFSGCAGTLLTSLIVRERRRIRIKAKTRTFELEAASEAEAEDWLQAILASV